ncbi:MAG: LacI family DNA-binding transcriptional regulator [Bacteroidales bacterium]|nr:LacI family DNA-binding transcriptional regulator [Bacteroidales bacterium]
MSKDGNKVTINDVARAAGVSKGTVDRVIHNRGEVSRKSKEKVLRVIEELGFRPNLYASLLASQKERVISCMIPECLSGEFWSLADKGFHDGAAVIGRYGFKVNVMKYDQYSMESFRCACEKVLESEPSGVIMAPLFREEVIKFAEVLSGRDIPYIYIDTKVEDTDYLAYFGMPMYQSGMLCADLLLNGSDVPDKVYVIRIARDKEGLSDPTVERRSGFLDYMSENYPDVLIENVFIDPKDSAGIDYCLDKTVGAGSGSRHVVMFNSRIHIIADYMKKRGFEGWRVVGFDALERNIEALRQGNVQVLVAQHTDHQALEAVTSMTDHLILGEKVRKDNFTQMDILTKYNCDYYL